MIRSGLRCALWSVLLSFPAAALIALLYRFPIPFAGYRSGVKAVPQSLGAVVFYGLLGGFLVVAGLGALGGMALRSLSRSQSSVASKLEWLVAGVVACSGALFLAVLDKIIGPW